MDDLPADGASGGLSVMRSQELGGFFLEICEDVRAFVGGREQERDPSPETAYRYFVAAGFHRDINRVSTEVENFRARDPAGVRWKQLRVRPPCTGRGPSI